MLRRPQYWATTFALWTERHGVSRLSSDLEERGLGVTPDAIYKWLAGRTAPSADRAVAISEISGGQVSVEDVLRHRSQVAVENRE